MTWNAYQRRVNEWEMRQLDAWEHTRIIGCEVFNNDNQKPLHYTKYLPLPTDHTEERSAAKKAADLAFLDEMTAAGRI